MLARYHVVRSEAADLRFVVFAMIISMPEALWERERGIVKEATVI